MTESRKHTWLAVSAIIVAMTCLLIANHFMAEARLKKIAEHTGEIHEKQMRHLKDDAAWGIKKE